MNRSLLLPIALLSGALLAARPATAQLHFFDANRYLAPVIHCQPAPVDVTLLDNALAQRPTTVLAEPLRFDLAPNPAAGAATVTISNPEARTVTLAVYDLLGRPILAPAVHSLSVGTTVLPLTLENQPAGVYVVTIEAAGQRSAQRLVKP